MGSYSHGICQTRRYDNESTRNRLTSCKLVFDPVIIYTISLIRIKGVETKCRLTGRHGRARQEIASESIPTSLSKINGTISKFLSFIWQFLIFVQTYKEIKKKKKKITNSWDSIHIYILKFLFIYIINYYNIILV